MTPGDNHCPYDSAHHVDTTEGDTFGGAGTSREFREEDLVVRSSSRPSHETGSVVDLEL